MPSDPTLTKVLAYLLVLSRLHTVYSLKHCHHHKVQEFRARSRDTFSSSKLQWLLFTPELISRWLWYVLISSVAPPLPPYLTVYTTPRHLQSSADHTVRHLQSVWRPNLVLCWTQTMKVAAIISSKHSASHKFQETFLFLEIPPAVAALVLKSCFSMFTMFVVSLLECTIILHSSLIICIPPAWPGDVTVWLEDGTGVMRQ